MTRPFPGFYILLLLGLFGRRTNAFVPMVRTFPTVRLVTCKTATNRPVIRRSTTLRDVSKTDEDAENRWSTKPPSDALQLTLSQRIKKYFSPPDDGLTFRQRLAKMGLAAVLSYGWVSNMSYCVSVSAAWYIFSSQTGLSPLAPGQWKKFLAVYAGFFVFNNIVRPIRFAVAVGISPQFDKVVANIQTRLRVNKATATAITVIIANIVGTTALMCAGIALAATLAGVPVFAKS